MLSDNCCIVSGLPVWYTQTSYNNQTENKRVTVVLAHYTTLHYTR